MKANKRQTLFSPIVRLLDYASLPRFHASFARAASMDKQLLFQFLDTCRLGVLSSLGPMGAPQSALVGIAVRPEPEIIFDTVEKSRKFANIARNPRVAFVICWQRKITVQYEGVARRISSAELGPYHMVTTTKPRRILLSSCFEALDSRPISGTCRSRGRICGLASRRPRIF